MAIPYEINRIKPLPEPVAQPVIQAPLVKPKRVYKKKTDGKPRKDLQITIKTDIRVQGMSFGHGEYGMEYLGSQDYKPFRFGPLGSFTIPEFEAYLEKIKGKSIKEIKKMFPDIYRGCAHRIVLHTKYLNLAKEMLKFVKKAQAFKGKLIVFEEGNMTYNEVIANKANEYKEVVGEKAPVDLF